MSGVPQSALCRETTPVRLNARRISAVSEHGLECGDLGTATARPALIGPDELQAVSVVNGLSKRPILFLCDHAGNQVPKALGDLGLSSIELQRHIAYDPGAAALTRSLAEHFAATALFANYSRLLVDPNRGLDHPDLFWEQADGTEIPGNQGLTDDEKVQRLASFYWPYHRQISAQIDRLQACGVAPAVIGMHTFTPALKDGPNRPWHVGVLWRRDGRIAVPLMQRLRLQGNLCVGDNQPYSGMDYLGGSMERHPIPRGLPHVVIEIRNDLLNDAEGVRSWTRLLGAVLEPVLATLAIDPGTQLPMAAE